MLLKRDWGILTKCGDTKLLKDRHIHDESSCTSVIANKECPSTCLQKILSVEKRKPSTDLRALNGSSSLSIDGNTELEKKAAEKDSKCRTTRGPEGPSVRSSTQTPFWEDFP